MLGVHCCVKITPFKQAQRILSDSSVDRLAILSVPNDKGIVFAKAGQEFVIGTELQFQNLLLDTSQDCHRSFSCHVPKDNWRIRNTLENSTLLACCYYVARIRNSESRDFHVVTSEELLLVLV